MLRFDTTTQISTKILFICIFQHCLGGRGVVRSNCDPKKSTLLGIHDYWTGVPTTFDLHCRHKNVKCTIANLMISGTVHRIHPLRNANKTFTSFNMYKISHKQEFVNRHLAFRFMVEEEEKNSKNLQPNRTLVLCIKLSTKTCFIIHNTLQ